MRKVTGKARKNKWDQNDLIRRLCHALDIAKRAVTQLAANGYVDRDEPRNSLRPEKLISETAFFLLAASTVEHTEIKARIVRVIDLLLPHARSERMLLGICLNPALALDYAQAHICLCRLGYPDPRFDAVLEESRRSQSSSGHERVPHRVLEQEWSERGWQQCASGRYTPATRTSSLSILNSPMDLLRGSSEDIYAFTHALLYVRDFNIHPLPLPRKRLAILAEAEAALARSLDEQDYDVAGEVLLAWPLTGRSWSASAAFGFRVLARVEDKAGFLPTSGTRLDRLRKLEGSERDSYLLASAYHTAYVMGLLCALALQPGTAPQASLHTKPGALKSAERLLVYLDYGAPPKHWREEVEQLEIEEREAIAPLLLNIALRRKVLQNDFAAVRDLLQLGDSLGISDGPASGQAAEMLSRLSAFANLVQARDSQLCPAVS